MAISKEDLGEIVKATEKATQDAIHKELGHYKVDKELHYKHHIFLDKFMDWYDDITSTFWKTLVKSFVGVLLFLILIGFLVWGHGK